MNFPDQRKNPVRARLLPSRAGNALDAGSSAGASPYQVVGWLPFIGLPILAVAFTYRLPPWLFMWTFAFSLFEGCKWLTWWPYRRMNAPAWRHAAYLFGWVGMDAKAFLEERATVTKPTLRPWLAALTKMILGAVLTWGVVRLMPNGLAAGWIGLFGLVLMMHFGGFHLLALFWQTLGINAQPLMRSPMLATSLADFWGVRWNTAFHLIAQKSVFRPLARQAGAVAATFGVFVISGLVHDAIISVPAHGGYGLPTAYFIVQGLGVLFERSKTGRTLGLGRGMRGRIFAIVVTVAPVYWLFHPIFIRNVILPMLHAIGAN